MSYEARCVLQQKIKGLHGSDEYSDLTIACGTETFKVHKNIVCVQSGFFERAMRFPVGKENAENTVRLPEDDPTIVKLYIQFLYEAEYDPRLPDDFTGVGLASHAVTAGCATLKPSPYNYEFPHTCDGSVHQFICPDHTCSGEMMKKVHWVCDMCCSPLEDMPGDEDQLLLHANMYAIGEKYDTESLKAVAREKFRRSCCRNWDTDDFVPAAAYVFSSTPDSDMGLRNIVAQALAEATKEIFCEPDIEVLLEDFPRLAIAVLKLRV